MARNLAGAYSGWPIPWQAHTLAGAYPGWRIPWPAHTLAGAYPGLRIPCPAHTVAGAHPNAYRERIVGRRSVFFASAYLGAYPVCDEEVSFGKVELPTLTIRVRTWSAHTLGAYLP